MSEKSMLEIAANAAQNERTYLSAFRSIMRTIESNMSKYVELKKCEEDQPKPKRAAAKAMQEIMEKV